MSRRIALCLLTLALVHPVVDGSQARGAQPAAPQGSASARVTFTETIAPIVYANCVTCHRPGEAAPFSLISYEDVAKRGALIAKVTESRYMPPWHAEPGFGEFVGERRLTDTQVAAFAAWVKQGLPRGDESKMPKLPAFPADGWRLGQPDLVLDMPAGFEVPASGPDVFRNFVIPMKLAEDKWVRGIEFRPSARKVVHHAIFAQVPGGSRAALDGADGRPGFGGLGAVGVVTDQTDSAGLGGWAVGATPMMYPAGMVTRLPKGSDFLLQLHFHPSGKVESERSQIGIFFADKPSEASLFSVELPALFGFGAGIDIPAGEKQFTIRDSFTLPGDVRLYLANAHAHYLATQMNAVATLPDGTTRRLLYIRDWDFNWQDSYIYKAPLSLPKGTRLDVTLIYDNSASNPRNPISPPRRALFGEQSFDEMGAIGFMFEVVNKDDAPFFQQALGERSKVAIQAAGKNGTLGRFLARQQRQRSGRQQLTVYDRTGQILSKVGEAASFYQPTLSPDGSRVAVIKNEIETDTQDVWVYDVATGKGRAVTADLDSDSAPVWSPDGKNVAYVSIRNNTNGIYRRFVDASGAEEMLYQHPTGAQIILTDWSADGRYLCFWINDAMFVLPLTGERKLIALNQDEFFGRGGRLSPDSRLLAYNSNSRQGLRFQVYVRPFDPSTNPGGTAGGPAQQVSTGNGMGVSWRRDGKELFYLTQGPTPSVVMAVGVTGSSPFTASAPRPLFTLPHPVPNPAQLSQISSADGERFVFAVNLASRPAAPSTSSAR